MEEILSARHRLPLGKHFLSGDIYNKVYEAQFDPTLLYIFIDNYEVRRGFIFVKKL